MVDTVFPRFYHAPIANGESPAMPSIAAVLIVRNEERTLQVCLESLYHAVDEVVVCDTGSTDGTVAIAQAHEARLCHFTWCDDFAAARNFALEQVQSDWVLSIDADECIEDPETAGHFLSAFVQNRDSNTVGTVEIVNLVGEGTEAQEVVDHTERFFSRGRCRYEGAVHEQIIALEGAKASASTGVRLKHSGYVHIEEKARRNRGILTSEAAKHPDDEYVLYQLGKAHFSLKEHRQAVAAFEAASRAIHFIAGNTPMGRLGPVSREVLTGLAVTLAYAYVNLGEPMQAAALLEEHERIGHSGTRRADFHHALGYVHLMLGNITLARSAYLKSIRYGPATEDVRGTGSFSSAYHLGLLAEADRDRDSALAFYHQAIRLKPDYAPALSRCVDLAVEGQAPLLPDLWAICDHRALAAACRDRTRALLARGDTNGVTALIKAAQGISQELLMACRNELANFLREDGEKTV